MQFIPRDGLKSIFSLSTFSLSLCFLSSVVSVHSLHLCSSSLSSPHPDLSSPHGDLRAAGLHRHHRQRGGHEVHQGGGQQPGHQDSHRRDRRGSLPARRWDFRCVGSMLRFTDVDIQRNLPQPEHLAIMVWCFSSLRVGGG